MRTRLAVPFCLSLVLSLLTAAAAPRGARAEVTTYRAAPSPDGAASLRVELPYTFGTHEFEVREVRGEIRVDWTAPTAPAVSGRLAVSITALRGGGETMSCHMREALGLDYARSAFPREHVCSGGKLPATGNDAVAFPEIVFDIKSAARTDQRLTLTGRWTIHGVTRDDTLELVMTPLAGEGARPRAFRVAGTRKLRLAHYGIQVKRALVIAAGEEATVKINLVLEAPR